MSDGRKLRLIQVAKEFKVGINTITDFLQKKGIKSDGSPNSLVEADVYAVLEKEFGANRTGGRERDAVREKIAHKQGSVSIDEARPAAQKEEKEVIVKSNVISVKDEVQQVTVLGKIDLNAKKPAAKPTAAPKAEPAAAPKPVSKPAPQPAPEPAPAPQPAPEPVAEPQAEMPKSEPVAEKPAAEVKERTHEPAAEKSPAAEVPQPAPVQPQTPAAAEQQTAPESAESPKVVPFRVSEPKLTGPNVLGKIDVSNMVPGGRRKRKRVSKEKITDFSAAHGAAPSGQSGKQSQGGGGGKQKGGQNQQAAQSAAAQSRKEKKKGQKPKPVVRPEVSDEEVSKQIKDTLARLTAKGNKTKSAAKYRKEKRELAAERMNEAVEREEMERSTLKVTEFVTVSELATMMDVAVTDVITSCMNLGLMVSINQRLDAEALVVVAEEFGFKVEFVSADIQEAIDTEVDSEESLVPRPPIVTVMGHVDHGKTSLLDNIRKTNVIEGEAGGITQHIGAYSVELNGQRITFLDTPGHEAFTAMRARGAKVTDVAIIIVAADDSVMPQTIEAITHAQAAGVPMVFAINKIDKPGANPEHIKEQLAGMNFLVEDWGGKYQSQDISAKKGLNLDKLLEKVLLEAEILELKANPDRKAAGTVIESTLDKGRGYVATVLVQNGTLRVGDVMLSGTHTGRVKAMFNENGKKVTEAGPSTPVLVLGLNGAPQAGDTFNVMDDDRSAREIANKREQLLRMQGIMTQKHVTLDEIGRRIAIGSFKELNIIVKGDVDGSVEAMSGSLIKLSKESVQVNVIHAAVGQISESDVLLAAASNAIIVGFQVRPSAAARKVAEKEEIEIRLYSIIYDAINDIKDAIEGMLEPVMKEEIVCSAEVMEVFKISKVGTVAGCIVREGKLQRSTPIRVIRDGIVVYTGKLGSLKRFKDDVKEVLSGQDCGLNIESYNDIRVGDIVEGYEQVEVKRK